MKSKLTFVFFLFFCFSTILHADENLRCDINFAKTNTCMQVDWIYGPYLDQYNSLKLTYSENPIIASINVIPWMVMPTHEHGSRPVVLTKTANREYLAEKAYFMGGMEGNWFLKIQLLDSNKSNIEETRYLINFKQ